LRPNEGSKAPSRTIRHTMWRPIRLISHNVSAVATFLNRTREALLPGGARTRWRNVVYCRDYYFRNQIRDSDLVHPCADSFVM